MGAGTWIAIGAMGLLLLMMLGASTPPLTDTTYIRFDPEVTTRTYERWLDWGTMYPGYNVTKVVTLDNGYPHHIRVRARTDNWSPEHAKEVLHFLWDSEDIEIPVNTTREAKFHLYAPHDIESPIAYFTFDIVVTVVCEDCVIET
jgi:hypothetical protein